MHHGAGAQRGQRVGRNDRHTRREESHQVPRRRRNSEIPAAVFGVASRRVREPAPNQPTGRRLPAPATLPCQWHGACLVSPRPTSEPLGPAGGRGESHSLSTKVSEHGNQDPSRPREGEHQRSPRRCQRGCPQAGRRRSPALFARAPGPGGRAAGLLPGVGGAQPHAAALDRDQGDLLRRRAQGRGLSVRRVPDGAASGQQPAQPRHRAGGADGHGRARLRS
jgi:hypothetical protein